MANTFSRVSPHPGPVHGNPYSDGTHAHRDLRRLYGDAADHPTMTVDDDATSRTDRQTMEAFEEIFDSPCGRALLQKVLFDDHGALARSVAERIGLDGSTGDK